MRDGARLLAFTEAVMADGDEALHAERSALRAAVPPAAFVDACAVIAIFNVVDRVADATGIPLDEPLAAIGAVLEPALNLRRFASAANTPPA